MAGNRNPYGGVLLPVGLFLDLTIGQADLDPAFKGAVPANYLQGIGITCDVLPGFVKTDQEAGYLPGEPGIYTYNRKA